MATSVESELSVETQVVTFPSLALDCGVTLLNVDVAYETYGTLDAERKNAILALRLPWPAQRQEDKARWVTEARS